MGAATPPSQESLKLQIYEAIVAKQVAKGKRTATVDKLSAKLKSLADNKLLEVWPGVNWVHVPLINKGVWECADFAIANEHNKAPEPPTNVRENAVTAKSKVKHPEIQEAEVNEKVKINA